jgi:probable rRNA maturation factor
VTLNVDVQNATNQVASELIPDNVEIERWVHMTLKGKYEDAQLTVRIVGYEESQHLNQTYRHRPGPTNVLSFPFEQPEMVQPPLLGDIVICAPLVIKEAAEQRKDVLPHWSHLVVHGVLHLLGYDHELNHDAEIMENLEKEIMAELSFPDPYAENGSSE